MSFISLQFLVFFMVVTLSYYQFRNQQMRVGLLLAASCYFHMAFVPSYILILGGTIVIDYLAGLQIARSTGKARKSWLIVSIIANVGILAFFKYFNFLLGTIEPLIHWVSTGADIPVLRILLPIGLSFHTFQAMSYTIEVYRGKATAGKRFSDLRVVRDVLSGIGRRSDRTAAECYSTKPGIHTGVTMVYSYG